VVKADGLAAGKGVVVAQTIEEAEAAIDSMLTAREFGSAGAEIVIEEFLVGEEASFFALVDGKTALPLASAQDHKTVGEGDTGPNTGGMGAYSPAPIVTDSMAEQVMKTIIMPTVHAMEVEGRPFTGVLYAGLMIGPKGPKLIEYNVRFGDPECQALCLRLTSDLLPALVAASDGMLANFHLRWKAETSLTVVMATRGYPGSYQKGSEIRGLDRAALLRDVVVFHAATERSPDGRIRANGGRVLGVSALGKSVAEAQARAYAAVDQIDWPEGFCRRDIGWRAVGARGGDTANDLEK
jgi:phosphoribosylamine--glycine ligase